MKNYFTPAFAVKPESISFTRMDGITAPAFACTGASSTDASRADASSTIAKLDEKISDIKSIDSFADHLKASLTDLSHRHGKNIDDLGQMVKEVSTLVRSLRKDMEQDLVEENYGGSLYVDTRCNVYGETALGCVRDICETALGCTKVICIAGVICFALTRMNITFSPRH